jgi:hypothetical protein
MGAPLIGGRSRSFASKAFLHLTVRLDASESLCDVYARSEGFRLTPPPKADAATVRPKVIFLAVLVLPVA